MNNFVITPSRLIIARQRLGMTLVDLAAASGISRRSLSYYEKGGASISRDSLQRLSVTLDVPESFFYRGDIEVIPVEAVSFRKLSKASARQRNMVLAEATLGVEFYELLSQNFLLPSSNIPTFDKVDPELAADMVRKRWGLSDRPISNMMHLIESKGVRVLSLNPSAKDIDAFCLTRDDTSYMFMNTSKTGERQRFDIAHELGHLVLHGGSDMSPADSREREQQANKFASEFLMPRSRILAQQLDNPTLERIFAAKRYWKVSALAMTHRLHAIGLLTDARYRACCIELADKGFRFDEPDGIVHESSSLLKQTIYGRGKRVSFADAGQALSLHMHEVKTYAAGLVPMLA
ncbi:MULTISPECIES: ImmA/IrrE family metallo-endopeptidase [Bifidobacterium]|jgi:Zn-dependent peptidase ImmA (M78 family)|uniref:ImmA/IrrE family metallo-endopeptidase n=1 Tax=Bifidobacterium tibiigranuli TaxID=2172043 RepID=A0A5N6S2I9_9BIFI|nr:ImmA/IrrE family metallo-endopeptidase [Bifidobacterium tibiigranuli]KAE8127446.1 ImmA/IrrE family metallo-endopeptidase [Bifidobacterium tibiigranuli]KAE8127891.1 XRE family transcriptional regulator [Bifidobacterium tibiigranuli]